MRNVCYIITVLCFQSASLMAQINGPTTVCPDGQLYNYSLSSSSSCNNNGFGGPLNARWSVSGGVFVDQSDGSESTIVSGDISGVSISWRSAGPSFAGAINVDYVLGPGPYPCGDTYLVHYTYPPGTAATDPVSVIPSTGSFCIGTVSTVGLSVGVAP